MTPPHERSRSELTFAQVWCFWGKRRRSYRLWNMVQHYIKMYLMLRQRRPKPYKFLKCFISFVKTVKSCHLDTIWRNLRWKSPMLVHFEEYHGNQTALNVIFHVVLSIYRFAKIWNSHQFPAQLRNGHLVGY